MGIKFLRLKDEAPDFIIQVSQDDQVRLSSATVRENHRTDNEQKFLTGKASEHSSSGPALHEMTPATISSRLVPNPPPSTPFVPPSRTSNEEVASVLAVINGSPSSTNVTRDAAITSQSQVNNPKLQTLLSLPNDVDEDNHDN
ncbi:hypothetical protein Tco_0704479 [Tanacetum coccineum]|uniref:Uncharacterized protein n=1 Tax=Tanacetum coccineum TaxID=301880 RepID=A0ABQ4Y1X2_9ASTR